MSFCVIDMNFLQLPKAGKNYALYTLTTKMIIFESNRPSCNKSLYFYLNSADMTLTLCMFNVSIEKKLNVIHL